MGETIARRTVQAIAGVVGMRDPFAAEPREVYQRVRRLVAEHEAMRLRLARIVFEADAACGILRDVEADDAAHSACDGGGDV